MNWGAFSGGMSQGIQKGMDPLGLKDMMMGQQTQQPEQLSGPPPEQGGDTAGMLASIMKIFGSMGG